MGNGTMRNTEIETFCKSIIASGVMMKMLTEDVKEIPFIRTCDAIILRMKFVAATSVRMKQKISRGVHVISTLVSVNIEEDSKKVRNMVLRCEKTMDREKRCTKSVCNLICSCGVRWTGDGLSDSSCWHIRDLRVNVAVASKMEISVGTAFEERNERNFGKFINIEDRLGAGEGGTA